MEELRSAMAEHMDQTADLIQTLSAELRSGLRPAVDNFIGFFHAIHWKEPWLMGLLGFHGLLLILTIFTRKRTKFQMFLFLLALAGVSLAERINKILRKNWKSFASQNYFDSNGVFLSSLWSGPLLVISMMILINTLLTLCYQVVRWKRSELRHRARVSQSKED